MGMDVSFVIAPERIDEKLLAKAAKGLGQSKTSLLVGDRDALPEPLAKALPDPVAISLWAPEPLGASWDSFGIAIAEALPETKLLAVTMSDHGSTGCWQVIEGGKTGPAHWLEEGYTRGIFLGLEAAYGVELKGVKDVFFAENVCQGVNKGWSLPAWKPLDAKGIEKALEGYSCMLEHPGKQLAPPKPPAPPRPEIVPPTDADRELVEALGKLTVTSIGRQVLIADLKKIVAGGSALTKGQRAKARELLAELG
ncbi:MAG TPA: hypothetical protein VFF73_27500 [Planctomycetota bacterium]|nr:hypothetical protein [Planctomycetota bacterium]